MSCVAVFQFNPTVGDVLGNAQKIVAAAEEAKAAGATLLLTPELALTGYSPEDLLFKPAFWQQVSAGLDQIEALDDITVVVGHPQRQGDAYYNAASVYRDGHRLGVYQKMCLPNDGVFDEVRYFEAGAAPLVFAHEGTQMGLIICEDTWATEPALEAQEAGAEVILSLNASPFYVGKLAERQQQARYRTEETDCPLIYVNAVGGQDELVFDGASFALSAQGEVVFQAPAFSQSLHYLTLDGAAIQPQAPATLPEGKTAWQYQALVLATRDYMQKSGFKKACLGLSGGLDSALVLAIAADAIGADNCEVLLMPSQYTADISNTDAVLMAQTLGVKHHTVAIEPMFAAFKTSLIPVFDGAAEDVTEENLQARIRGTLLMALSNKSGALLLTTGNKSELATGYCTLYGDMNGGFAVIKDILKTEAYEMARYVNTLVPGQETIPTRIITRPPSAELRANQTDQDSLPDYTVLDGIIERVMIDNASATSLIQQGYDAADVTRVLKLLKISEHKRRQGAIGPKVSRRNFGKDWRMPICQRFNEC
ncbi:MAG: NAD+ synthase [Neisseriaceae bacterium]|nr:NAD+ synthase [Neisseriaceae bacterium]